jgi:hypothetical protein
MPDIEAIANGTSDSPCGLGRLIPGELSKDVAAHGPIARAPRDGNLDAIRQL